VTGQFYDYGLNIMRSCQCLQSKRNGVFFCPIRFQSLCNRPVIRSMTIIMSIGGIFDIFQTISIGIFSLKRHERVFTI
jgi:hypothetical protein